MRPDEAVDLDVPDELALARLEASLRPALREHARAALAASSGTAPLPAALGDAAVRRDLARLLPVWRDVPGLRRDAGWLGRAFIAALEAEPTVAAARGNCATWAQLDDLTARRRSAAQAIFGAPLATVLAAATGLEGVSSWTPAALPPPPPPRAWGAPGGTPPVTEHALRVLWRQVAPTVSDAAWRLRADDAGSTVVLDRPRGATVAPAAVVSVVPLGATSVRGWAVALHELGHAVVGAAHGPLPRLVDERAALAVQRWLSSPGWLPWISEPTAAVAAAGFATLVETARHLAARDATVADGATSAPSFAPPRALIDDPGAQAVYVAAAAAAPVAPLDGGSLLAIGALLA